MASKLRAFHRTKFWERLKCKLRPYWAGDMRASRAHKTDAGRVAKSELAQVEPAMGAPEFLGMRSGSDPLIVFYDERFSLL